MRRIYYTFFIIYKRAVCEKIKIGRAKNIYKKIFCVFSGGESNQFRPWILAVSNLMVFDAEKFYALAWQKYKIKNLVDVEKSEWKKIKANRENFVRD